MASQLTIVAVVARRMVKYGIFATIIITILRFAWGFGADIYRQAVPPKLPPATMGFGPLDPIIFPDKKIELPELEYTVETADGRLPNFPKQMRVYAMPQLTSNFSSYDSMIQTAAAFGFTQEPIQLKERLYQFNHGSIPVDMKSDIVTKTFTISFNLAADASPLSNRSLTVNEAKEVVVSKLKQAKSFPADLEGETESLFLKVQAKNLVRALALQDAQLVQINLFRSPITIGDETTGITEFPIVTFDPNKANVWFIVSGSGEENKDIIAGEYRYLPVDRNLFETYNIKTAEEALNDLVSGEAYISNLGLNLDGNITIRRIYLAYYDPNDVANFMQPVIVFEGEDDFLAYVPAVTKDSIAAPSQGN